VKNIRIFMSSFNRVIMAGNLTRDPDYKQLTSGQSVCRLGLASNRQFKNKQSGDMIQEVCYIDVDVWGPQAESCRQYLQKGRPVLVEGRLKLDTWDDANGQKRSKHSIVADRVVFLGSNAQAQGETAVNAEDAQRLDPNNPMEKELMSQIEQIKSRTAAKSQQFEAAKVQPTKKRVAPAVQPAQETTAGGEIAFTDEPPFADDLPF
jgi:single-strand DNA-binding protein